MLAVPGKSRYNEGRIRTVPALDGPQIWKEHGHDETCDRNGRDAGGHADGNGLSCSSRGVEGVFCSISKDPVEQTAFQISSEREKAAVVTALFREAQAAHGCEQAFIYCNSLSGSVDFDAIARETGVAVVTPLDVYRALAPQYRLPCGHCRQRAGRRRYRADAAAVQPGFDAAERRDSAGGAGH